jgi:rod shape-determining protein MreD
MAQKKEKFLKIKIFILFLISLFAMIFFSCFINIRFIYFAPLIVFLFYRFTFISILWTSIILGFLQDLFSTNFFGINAICYFLTSAILYREKRFFNDKPINLSIFTSIFSLIFSVFNPFLFFIFDKKINLSIKWVGADLVILPLLDGIYAFIFFALPILLFEKLIRIGFKNLWIKYKKMIFQKSR